MEWAPRFQTNLQYFIYIYIYVYIYIYIIHIMMYVIDSRIIPMVNLLVDLRMDQHGQRNNTIGMGHP